MSLTTRNRRENEIDGVHYKFVSHAEFDRMIAEDQFVEYCKVHTNMYGTAKSQVAELQAKGIIPLLDIDV